MMSSSRILEISAERSQLAAIRSFIRAQASATQASSEEVDDLVLAVDELVTNIVVHGYGDTHGEIEIEFITQPNVLTVILRDRASLFDPTQAPEPDVHLPLELRPMGGMGIYLARKCVDYIEHQAREGGGNILKLEIHLKG